MLLNHKRLATNSVSSETVSDIKANWDPNIWTENPLEGPAQTVIIDLSRPCEQLQRVLQQLQAYTAFTPAHSFIKIYRFSPCLCFMRCQERTEGIVLRMPI
jgi:hypothetical protein